MPLLALHKFWWLTKIRWIRRRVLLRLGRRVPFSGPCPQRLQVQEGPSLHQ